MLVIGQNLFLFSFLNFGLMLIRFSSIFLFIICLNFNLPAQNQEDVIECISLVFQSSEVLKIAEEDFYKENEFLIQLSEGPNNYGTEEEKILQFLGTQNFIDAPSRIRIIREADIKNEEIQAHQTWSLQLIFQQGRILIQVSTRVEEARKFWQGFFILENQQDDWTILEKNTYFR